LLIKPKELQIADNLIIPIEAVTQTFAILAKRGVGKTYSALVMVEELLKANTRVVVADPVGVCWGLRAGANGKSPGLPIIVLGGEHGDLPLEATVGSRLRPLELCTSYAPRQSYTTKLDGTESV
jgi:hypothetical protein